MVLLIGAWQVRADDYTVYRTVAEDGSVSFSDRRPQAAAGVEIVRVQVPVAAESAQVQRERLRSLRETTDRMAADRMARERHRAELRESAARARALRQPTEAVAPEQPGYYVLRPAYRHPHPGFRPRPGHLPVRPHPVRPHPVRPTPLPSVPAGLGRVQAYNSQLKRSMLSYTR
jgi:hypothetical protein